MMVMMMKVSGKEQQMCLQLAGQLGSPSECGRVRCWASPLKIYLSFTTRLSQLPFTLLVVFGQLQVWEVFGSTVPQCVSQDICDPVFVAPQIDRMYISATQSSECDDNLESNGSIFQPLPSGTGALYGHDQLSQHTLLGVLTCQLYSSPFWSFMLFLTRMS